MNGPQTHTCFIVRGKNAFITIIKKGIIIIIITHTAMIISLIDFLNTKRLNGSRTHVSVSTKSAKIDSIPSFVHNRT
jgi:hypothetical protein